MSNSMMTSKWRRGLAAAVVVAVIGAAFSAGHIVGQESAVKNNRI